MVFNALVKKLKKAGLRKTPQRMAICKLLSESVAHPTAREIYDQVKKQYPMISLGTVYNTLDELVDLGAITDMGTMGDDAVHYDGNTSLHLHLGCLSCHKITDMEAPRFNHLSSEIGRLSGFTIFGSRFVYYGLCPDCQKSIQTKSIN